MLHYVTTTNLKKKIKKVLLSFTFYWVSLLTSLYAVFYLEYSIRTLISYFTLIILVFIILQYVTSKKTYLTLFVLSSLIISSFSFIELSHFIIFKGPITESTIYIALETTKSEFSEFTKTYLLRTNVLVIFFLHFLSFSLSIYFAFKKYTKNRFKLPFKISALLFLIIIATFYKVRLNFFPYILLKSTLIFVEQREAFKEMTINKNGSFKNVLHISNDKKETYVLIIGESTTKTHMGIYGYDRNTTPLLKRRKNGIVIYNSVTTPHTHTIEALNEVLTVSDSEDRNDRYNRTLIQLMNSSDFKTYFISNQKPIGIYETSITLISKMSDKSYFTDVSRNKYDGAILSPLKKVLKENDDKKFIIIHLMGTHSTYESRYPKEFEIFKDMPTTKFKHNLAYKTINEYDNAILYNDFIINEIINEVAKENCKANVLYFSDHGEDVYETINEACHVETKATPPMYQIPFIMWFSDTYKKTMPKEIVLDTNRIYNSKDLIYTLSDLYQISFDEFNPKKSILNKEYNKNNYSK